MQVLHLETLLDVSVKILLSSHPWFFSKLAKGLTVHKKPLLWKILPLNDRNFKRKHPVYILTILYHSKANIKHCRCPGMFNIVHPHKNACSQKNLHLICVAEEFEETTSFFHVGWYCTSCRQHVFWCVRNHSAEVRNLLLCT